MKKTIYFIAYFVLWGVSLLAQPPHSFKYQAVARDINGNVLADQNVSFQVTILQGSVTGITVYRETHSVTTNQYGLANLEIGSGTAAYGVFSVIPWYNGEFFLKVEMDPTGNQNYQMIGVCQLLSVPYALNAGSLTLTSADGNQYSVGVDNDGNLVIDPVNTGWNCGSTLVDPRDGKEYSTIPIGTQCWMAENLDIGSMIAGIDAQQNNGIIEKYCHGDNTANCETYGGLYQWNELMQYSTSEGTQGICPQGWHLPADSELEILTDFMGGDTVAGGKMKEIGYEHWAMPNVGATNESGFTGLPGGHRNASGEFWNLGSTGNFWSSTQETVNSAWRWYLDTYTDDAIRVSYDMEYAYSARCIKGKLWKCGDTIHDSRNNKVYNTVEIGNQCWMKENLNIGTMISYLQDQQDNGIIEKYCFWNDTANCAIYGGLYQWNEMMHYINQEGIQGICPVGWHVPTEAEWCTMTQFIDPTVNCSAVGWNGTDVGTKMKNTTGWDNGGNGTNTSGYSALPGGLRYNSPDWDGLGTMGVFWTSTSNGTSYAWCRDLESSHTNIFRYAFEKEFGYSIRCMKD